MTENHGQITCRLASGNLRVCHWKWRLDILIYSLEIVICQKVLANWSLREFQGENHRKLTCKCRFWWQNHVFRWFIPVGFHVTFPVDLRCEQADRVLQIFKVYKEGTSYQTHMLQVSFRFLSWGPFWCRAVEYTRIYQLDPQACWPVSADRPKQLELLVGLHVCWQLGPHRMDWDVILRVA